MLEPNEAGDRAADTKLPAAFYVFWAGQGLSALGDAMTLVAMPLVVLSETGSVTEMGKLTALSRSGALIATALAGFVIDGMGPRRVMIACDLIRCVLLSSVPFAWKVGTRAIEHLFFAAFGAALAQGVFYVGHVSLVAGLVGKSRVGLANSRVESTIALSYVFGPLLAGTLSNALGPTSVLGIDAFTFLASAASLQWMHRLLAREPVAAASAEASAPSFATSAEASAPSFATSAEASAPSAAASPDTRHESGSSLLAGLRFLRNEPELLPLTLFVGACQFFTAGIVDLIVFRLKHEQGLSDSATGFTFAIASAAAAVSAAATPWLRRRYTFHHVWVTGVVLQALASLACAGATSLAAISATAALYLGAMTVLLICQASTRQELTPQHLLGRVTSIYLVLVSLPAPLGALCATSLSARFGTSSLLIAIGAGLLATAAVAALVWARPPRAAKH